MSIATKSRSDITAALEAAAEDANVSAELADVIRAAAELLKEDAARIHHLNESLLNAANA